MEPPAKGWAAAVTEPSCPPPAACSYAVRVPASHPVMENFRVRTFRQLLLIPPHTFTPGSMGPGSGGVEEEQLAMLGELMFFSHQSYSECGLGSAGTDRWGTVRRGGRAVA